MNTNPDTSGNSWEKNQPEHTRGPRNYRFWKSHGGSALVWSNPDANDSVMISRALLRPSFHLLLDIAVEFGLDRLKQIWQKIQEAVLERGYPEEIREVEHARLTVERCLLHIDGGLEEISMVSNPETNPSPCGPAEFSTMGVVGGGCREIHLLLQSIPETGDFVLVGSMGLALRLGHRGGEEFEFITSLPKLPVAGLDAIRRELCGAGYTMEEETDPGHEEESLTEDINLRDYDRNYVVNGRIRLEFSTASKAARKILGSEDPGETRDTDATGFRVGSLLELARLRALDAAERSNFRDWLDLFILERDHGFGIAGWKTAFDVAGLGDFQLDTAHARICRGKRHTPGEGYATLMPNRPAPEEVTSHFRRLRAEYERQTARDRLGRGTLDSSAIARDSRESPAILEQWENALALEGEAGVLGKMAGTLTPALAREFSCVLPKSMLEYFLGLGDAAKVTMVLGWLGDWEIQSFAARMVYGPTGTGFLESRGVQGTQSREALLHVLENPGAYRLLADFAILAATIACQKLTETSLPESPDPENECPI